MTVMTKIVMQYFGSSAQLRRYSNRQKEIGKILQYFNRNYFGSKGVYFECSKYAAYLTLQLDQTRNNQQYTKLTITPMFGDDEAGFIAGELSRSILTDTEMGKISSKPDRDIEANQELAEQSQADFKSMLLSKFVKRNKNQQTEDITFEPELLKRINKVLENEILDDDLDEYDPTSKKFIQTNNIFSNFEGGKEMSKVDERVNHRTQDKYQNIHAEDYLNQRQQLTLPLLQIDDEQSAELSGKPDRGIKADIDEQDIEHEASYCDELDGLDEMKTVKEALTVMQSV